MKPLLFVLPVLLLLLLVGTSMAHAEGYVGVYAGGSRPDSLESVEGKGSFGIDIKASDLALKNSPMYGLKAGYFLERLKWLGVEGEFFYSNPHVKQQTLSTTNPFQPTLDVQGAHMRVAVAALNLMARYPGGRFEPYVGVGPAIYWARFSSAGPVQRTASDTTVGLNVLAGARFFLTKQIALFGEYKYNQATFDFGGNVLLKGDYSANSVVGGLSVHFR